MDSSIKNVRGITGRRLTTFKPGEVMTGEAGLTGRLTRTKTSGAGKSLNEFRLFIPKTAYVVNETCLETGHTLWGSGVKQGQDYFIGRLAPDITTFLNKVATASDLSGMWSKSLVEFKNIKLHSRA